MRQLPLIAAHLLAIVAIGVVASAPAPQSLDERLDDDAFLQGVIDLELSALLEHYVQQHPPADRAIALEYAIVAARLRHRQLDPADPAAIELLDEIVDRRAELIAGFPDHPRRAIWLADQAADLLFGRLEIEASGLSALYGVPTASQRRRAVGVAEELLTLTREAEIEIERAVLAIEATPGYRADEGLQMRRRRLARDERERRIPFLCGVAACLYADLVEGEVLRRALLYEEALRCLMPLSDELGGWLGERARRYAARALIGLERHAEAAALLDAVLASPAALPADRFAAQLEQTRLLAARDGANAALAALGSLAAEYRAAEALLYRLLAVDARFRLLQAQGEIEAGFEAYLDLLGDPGSADPAVVRAIVLERLAAVADDGTPLDRLPAIVAVARAARLGREPRRGDEAISLLETVLDRPDLAGRDRAFAVLTLARACERAPRIPSAVAFYTEYAEEFPGNRDAESAIERAAALGYRLAHEHPDAPTARADVRRALDVLITRYPTLASIEQWRCLAGRLALDDGDAAGAIAVLAKVAPDAPHWLDVRVMIVRARREAVRAADTAIAREREAAALFEAADEVSSGLAAAIDRVPADRRAAIEHDLAAVAVIRAQTLLDLGQPARAINALAAVDGTVVDRDAVLLAASLRLRIEAAHELGRPEEARDAVDQFVQAAPRAAGPVLDSMIDDQVRELQTLLDEGKREEVAAASERDLVPLAERLEAWLDDSGMAVASGADAMRRRIAEAYRLAGRYEAALRVYEQIAVRHPDAVEILYGRAETLFGLEGRDTDAMAIYRRIGSGGAAVGHRFYWGSQLRMLEILDRAGRGTAQIAPRIRRLRLEDPDLGGEPFRRGFQRLEQKHAG